MQLEAKFTLGEFKGTQYTNRELVSDLIVTQDTTKLKTRIFMLV